MRLSLSSKILLSIGGLLAALTVVVASLTFVQTRKVALAQHEALADVLNYTFEILLSQEAMSSLQRVTENSSTIPSMQKITIVDRSEKVLASTDRLEVGKEAASPQARAFLAGERLERTTQSTDDAFIILLPLRGSRSMGGATGDIVGVAEVTLSLAMIEGEARAAALKLLAISLGSYAALSVTLVLVLRLLVTTPVRALATAARHFQEGQRKHRTGIRRADEIGLLSATFDAMADEVESVLSGLEAQVATRTATLEAQRGALETQHSALEDQRSALEKQRNTLEEQRNTLKEQRNTLEEQHRALEKALEDLKTSTAARLALADTVRELSTPVIRAHKGILVMPLIGSIDDKRAEQIQRSLLSGIQQHRAREVLLDVTGVAVVDTAVAAGLLRAARAAEMLGARVTLVGIRPQVAQSFVHLDVDLSGITTRADLESGLLHALQRQGLSVRRARRHS